MLSRGKNVILEIEIQGAMKIKEKISDTVLVFVTPPTILHNIIHEQIIVRFDSLCLLSCSSET